MWQDFILQKSFRPVDELTTIHNITLNAQTNLDSVYCGKHVVIHESFSWVVVNEEGCYYAAWYLPDLIKAR